MVARDAESAVGIGHAVGQHGRILSSEQHDGGGGHGMTVRSYDTTGIYEMTVLQCLDVKTVTSAQEGDGLPGRNLTQGRVGVVGVDAGGDTIALQLVIDKADVYVRVLAGQQRQSLTQGRGTEIVVKGAGCGGEAARQYEYEDKYTTHFHSTIFPSTIMVSPRKLRSSRAKLSRSSATVSSGSD